jgi:hypothetical protein
MSGNVVSDTGRPGLVENVGATFAIASLSHSVQKNLYFRSRVPHFQFR